MFSKILLRALAVGAVAFGCFTSAQAQQGCRTIVLPNGTVLTCQLVNGQKVYVDSLGNQYNANSTGTGSFTVTGSGTNPCTATLNPAAININSTDPILGNITTTLDLTRPSTPSRIVSLQIGNDFPAREDISFFANATVSSQPGRQFRSIQEVHLNGTVNSFNPHNNEVFNLVQPVAFEDVARPGVAVFTITQLRVTLGPVRK